MKNGLKYLPTDAKIIRIAGNAAIAVIARAIVCPSVTFRSFVQMNEDTIVRFSAPGKTTIPVSGEVKLIRIFAGNRPQRGR